MSDFAIHVENLSKRYRIGGQRTPYKTIRESLTSAIASPLCRWRDRRPMTDDGRPGPPSPVAGQPSQDDYIWALKNVSSPTYGWCPAITR